MPSHPWSIPGADGLLILGDAHLPAGTPLGVLLIAHGFKGYKDYGFIPYLAAQAAKAGLVAYRFNFSHSGMTNRLETFERPDLFETDTWGKQIHDLHAVATAARSGGLAGDGHDVPSAWFGHSRGGVTTLLAASRAFEGSGHPGSMISPAGVVAAASPDQALHLDDVQRKLLRKRGWLESPSSRTGQDLRLGRDALEEVEAAPEAFDPRIAAARLQCPLLLVHGDQDQTVPDSSSQRLQESAGSSARLEIIRGASHTFNAPNPLPEGDEPPEATVQLAQTVCAFATEVCGG